MRAYSLRQMQDLGICVDDYKTNERDGVFIATPRKIYPLIKYTHLKTTPTRCRTMRKWNALPKALSKTASYLLS